MVTMSWLLWKPRPSKSFQSSTMKPDSVGCHFAIIDSHPEKNGQLDPNRNEPITMVIGSNNVFEVGCQSEALKIDDNNIVESKARVGRDMILSSGCVVGACCNVETCEVLPENTVIYGKNCLRRLQSEKPQPQTLQLDFLMKILPNYHHLKRSPKPQTPPAKS
uniref:dynactin subunit 6 isoform X2 n=1 Tax=Myxine glutinosa TaxID=7769 RepID=UPI00358E06C8